MRRRPCTHEVILKPPERRNGKSRRQETDKWTTKTGCVQIRINPIRHEVDVIPLRRTEQFCNLFFAICNVNQTRKRTIGGTIGDPEATWQQWDSTKRLVVAERVVKLKSKLRDPMGKQRNEVTKFITQNNSRQEFGKVCGFTQGWASTQHKQCLAELVFNCTCHCNALHTPESPQGGNSSFWSSRQISHAYISEVP